MDQINILILEENTFLAHLLERFLRVELPGAGIQIAAQGEQALRLAASQPPFLALVTLDVPGLTRLQLITALRCQRPGYPVIALACLDDAYYRKAARAAGAFDLLSTDNLASNLVSTIRRALSDQKTTEPLLFHS